MMSETDPNDQLPMRDREWKVTATKPAFTVKHSHLDFDQAERLAAQLEAEGHDVTIASMGKGDL